MKLRPLHDRYLKRLEREEDRLRHRDPRHRAEKPDQGEVLAVGPGKKNEEGKLSPSTSSRDKISSASTRAPPSRSTARAARDARRRHHGRRGLIAFPTNSGFDRGNANGCQRRQFKEHARVRMIAGVNVLADAVKSPWPQGRKVCSSAPSAPHVTKDGVSVAKEIELKDNSRTWAPRWSRKSASKTSDVAGDGTPPRPCWPSRS